MQLQYRILHYNVIYNIAAVSTGLSFSSRSSLANQTAADHDRDLYRRAVGALL